jgi:hypothetical protein
MDQSFHLQKLGQAFKAMRSNRGLLDFARVCQVDDPREWLQRPIRTAEMVVRRAVEVAASIPHLIAAIQHCTDRPKEAFLD